MRNSAVFKGCGVGKICIYPIVDTKHTISPAKSSRFKCNFIEKFTSDIMLGKLILSKVGNDVAMVTASTGITILLTNIHYWCLLVAEMLTYTSKQGRFIANGVMFCILLISGGLSNHNLGKTGSFIKILAIFV